MFFYTARKKEKTFTKIRWRQNIKKSEKYLLCKIYTVFVDTEMCIQLN